MLMEIHIQLIFFPTNYRAVLLPAVTEEPHRMSDDTG